MGVNNYPKECWTDEHIKKMGNDYFVRGKATCPVCNIEVTPKVLSKKEDGLNKKAVKEGKIILDLKCSECQRRAVRHFGTR